MGAMMNVDEATAAGAREYLTFRLDQEEYGIDILKVQEIRGYEPPTRIAKALPETQTGPNAAQVLPSTRSIALRHSHRSGTPAPPRARSS